MAKELPYFRFTVSEWLNDGISDESYELKGLFADVCAWYWFKDCSINIAMLKKHFKDAIIMIDELIELGIIKISEDDIVQIKFLDQQFDLLSKKRQNYIDAGRAGGLKRSSNAKATLKQRSSYKDKDNNKDNNKEIEEQFEKFWNHFHSVTQTPKKERNSALKYWRKLTYDERVKAYQMVEPYKNSVSDPKFIKYARTYLDDKNFNDELRPAQREVKPPILQNLSKL